jgi:hypothetical protein
VDSFMVFLKSMTLRPVGVLGASNERLRNSFG